MTVEISGLGGDSTNKLGLVGRKFGQSEGTFGMLNLQICNEKDCALHKFLNLFSYKL